MGTVYDWVRSCLSDDLEFVFDLYMSPPKTVYPPTGAETLCELGMVPAVTLLLGWARS